MLDFRLFRPEDTGRCLALIQAGHDPNFTMERFRWLHEYAPLSPSCIAVCQDREDIVGIYSVIRRTVRLDNHTFTGGRDVDPVVSPSHRGRGVFTKLLDFGLSNFQGIDFFFNFANPASARGFKSRGWTDIGALEDRVCQLGYQSLFSREFLIWCCSGARIGRTLPAEAREAGKEEVAEFLKTLPTKWSAKPPLGRLWVDRSPEYLQWRYLDSPLRRYRFFLFKEEDRPTGMAVCRFDAEANQLFILDILGFDRPATVAPWLRLWARTFPGAWAGIWSTVQHEARPGFISNPLNRGKGQSFLVRGFSGRDLPTQLFQLDGWFLAHGDVEIT